jgi:hypothetical protein
MVDMGRDMLQDATEVKKDAPEAAQTGKDRTVAKRSGLVAGGSRLFQSIFFHLAP